jgi:uncharacterized integral membrane protein
MVRAILTVLLVLIIIAYGAMFLSWNQQTVAVTGFSWAGQGWAEDAPVGFLVLGGVLAGAILMAIFAVGAYQAQRSRAAAAEALVAQAKQKLGAAKSKVDELVAKAKQQREKIAQLEQEHAAEAAPVLEVEVEEPPAESEEDDEEI